MKTPPIVTGQEWEAARQRHDEYGHPELAQGPMRRAAAAAGPAPDGG